MYQMGRRGFAVKISGENIRKIVRNLLCMVLRFGIIRAGRERMAMAIINPVSDLRNYNTVLEQVNAGSPVYLTVNGRGRYTIRDIADDEEFEKAKAMLRLMCELNEGKRSGEEEGWVSEEDVRTRFRSKVK
jgi:hypothetical protein